MAYVYAVHNPMRFDPESMELVPRYDLTPASQWGELRYILGPRTNLNRPAEVIAKMDLILESFRNEDFLLPIGNPALIGWAVAIAAAHNSGNVQLLVWSGRDQAYIPSKSSLPIRHARV